MVIEGRSIPNIEEGLIQLLQRPDADRPADAGFRLAYALGWLGNKGNPHAIRTLLATLKSQDVRLRMEAAAALGRIGDKTVIAPLETLGGHQREDINVRANALVSLGRLGEESSQALLKKSLRDKDSFIVRCAEEGLRLSDDSVRFNRLSTEWAGHCQQVALRSNINEYLKCPSYRQIVELGRPAVPLIMEKYKRDDLPWEFALQDITGVQMIEDRNDFNPSKVKGLWLTWWAKEGPRWK